MGNVCKAVAFWPGHVACPFIIVIAAVATDPLWEGACSR
ncbi:hypothetical protein C4J89_4458 [Pseudomonas sp. R4-35-07]|nr:hypothetical protein C4J89_4458 [Pseudomonas sp. R4-35-07]